METEQKKLSQIVYCICLIAIAAFVILVVFCKLTDFRFVGKLSGGGCKFRAITGLYCPGCGGTRAVDALLRGQILLSLKLHPVVLYSFVSVIIFTISNTLSILTHEKIRALMFRESFFYVMIGVIALQWIIKNAIYFLTGVHII